MVNEFPLFFVYMGPRNFPLVPYDRIKCLIETQTSWDTGLPLISPFRAMSKDLPLGLARHSQWTRVSYCLPGFYLQRRGHLNGLRNSKITKASLVKFEQHSLNWLIAGLKILKHKGDCTSSLFPPTSPLSIHIGLGHSPNLCGCIFTELPRGHLFIFFLLFIYFFISFYVVFVCVLSCFSCVWLFVTWWTTVCQAPLSMGILQAEILEWVATPSSRESSQPRDETHVSCLLHLERGSYATI